MEQSIWQAKARLRQAREMLTEPWTRGPGSFQASLAQAVEHLRNAVEESHSLPRGEVEASVLELQRELGSVAVLLEGASRITSGWSQAGGLFTGVYGHDAEAIPVTPPPRFFVQA
jgi:hypothetical protein